MDVLFGKPPTSKVSPRLSPNGSGAFRQARSSKQVVCDEIRQRLRPRLDAPCPRADCGVASAVGVKNGKRVSGSRLAPN